MYWDTVIVFPIGRVICGQFVVTAYELRVLTQSLN